MSELTQMLIAHPTWRLDISARDEAISITIYTKRPMWQLTRLVSVKTVELSKADAVDYYIGQMRKELESTIENETVSVPEERRPAT